MGKTYKSLNMAQSKAGVYARKYGGKFVVKKLFGRYVVKRPGYGRRW